MPLDENQKDGVITALIAVLVPLLGAVTGLIVKVWKQATSARTTTTRTQTKRDQEVAEQKRTEHEFIVTQWQKIVDDLTKRQESLTARVDKIQDAHLQSEIQLAGARTLTHEQAATIQQLKSRCEELEEENRQLRAKV